jgi:ABC-type amino acid transport system permease subunit
MQQSVPQQSLPSVTRKPRSWLVILDYLFYTVLVVAVLAFIYYLYTYRDTIALDLPFLLQGAAVTIILSIISVVFAMILGFLGSHGTSFPLCAGALVGNNLC